LMEEIGHSLRDPPWETRHFTLRFGLRNPRCGQGLGGRGIEENLELIRCYAVALERAYEVLTRQGWKHPTKDGSKRRVYVFDTMARVSQDAPFTSRDKNGPFIGLRSVINEPDKEAMLRRAAIEAVHEATHVFNHPLLRRKVALVKDANYRTNVRAAWHWFD